MNKILSLDKLSKTVENDQEKIEVLNEVSFDLKEASLTTLIGPSGSGKSTLLRIIADLIPKTSGNIEWSDQKPAISFVFQNFALFPYLDVHENIEFGLKMMGVKEEVRYQKIRQLIEEVGLTGSEEKHPQELSGGMRQRVGIARALAMDPELLLLDEPFSSLDEFTAENLRKLLLQIWKNRKMTILMVTHLIEESIFLSDQILVLSKRPGRIKKAIECDLPRPRNERSKYFYHLEDRLKTLIQI